MTNHNDVAGESGKGPRRPTFERCFMDTFRSCPRLFVQAETEAMSDFMKRVPHKQACWLMRKSVQPSGSRLPEDAYALHIIGGSFGQK